MLKVMTILGTRPEIIKMSRIVHEFEQYTKHVLVHTGQNYDYELNEIFFEELRIKKPDYFLNVVGKNSAQTIGQVIIKTDEVLEIEKPDAVMLYGDTNSTLAVIAAKRKKIPIFHMEAGNRSFDENVPEELNRKVLDHLSDINLVLSENARRNLIAEGIRSEYIIHTGSHMKEVLNYYMTSIESSKILEIMKLEPQRYILVSAHREENIEPKNCFSKLVHLLNMLAEDYGIPVIVSTHPRTKNKVDKTGSVFHSNVRLIKPLSFSDYNKLQMEAFCVVSNSGTITEESSLLNIPAITIRNAHERPEGMDVGTLIMSGLKPQDVVDAVQVVSTQHQQGARILPAVEDYEAGAVSKKILRIVMSYTDYINRTVWRKTV
jgi:UDP-N-acetylglucosamine 2-epimerase (non-hydrolysing)